MSPSPTANRSFLHGTGKNALIPDKVVYATLDSLALKRTRLPLQLLPVESDNVADKTENLDKEKRLVNGKTLPKRSTYEVCRKYHMFNFCNMYLEIWMNIDLIHKRNLTLI